MGKHIENGEIHFERTENWRSLTETQSDESAAGCGRFHYARDMFRLAEEQRKRRADLDRHLPDCSSGR